MQTVGPYEFVGTDVDTTLAAGRGLFDQLELGLDAAAAAIVEPHRARAGRMLDAVLLCEGEPDEALVVLWDEWRAAMADLRAAGALGRSAVGTATGLFLSDGGVPKVPVESVEVDFGGVVGDRQDDRLHHGRPFQALCLWSTEVIDGFRADGHPLAPGLAGENVTITGLPWPRVRPGARLRLGDVLAEVTSYAVPCKKNADWFEGGHFGLMHHRHGPVSRVYALVVEPGRINLGDSVLLEP